MRISNTAQKKCLPIGIIGAGSIGSFVARAIVRGEVEGITLVAVADILPPSKDLLEELRSHSVAVVNSFTSLLEFPLKLVVECANQEVVHKCADLFISNKISN